MIKLSQNQNYYDTGPYVAKNGAALEKLINKLGRACSKQRSDIVLNAIGNLLVFEIAQCFETNQHQEIVNLLAQKITEGLQRYLAKEKMFAAGGELTDLNEINKHMN
jgi:hypothetical protein